MRNALLACAMLAAGCAAPGTPVPPPATPGTAQYEAGRAHHAAGRHALAVKAYRQALLADPGHFEARNAMAVAYAERGHVRLAATMLRDLAAGAPRDAAHAHLYNNLGYALLLAGDHVQAREALEQAVALAPGAPYPAANLRRLEQLVR